MMKINILGSGYMGKQIAGLFVLLGFDVFIWHNKNEKDLLKDVDSEIKKLEKVLNLKKSGKITIVSKLEDLEKNFTIETVKEDKEIKKKVLQSLRYNSNIFSNTSSIKLSSLGKNINGFHFMNPISVRYIEVCEINDYSIDDLKYILEKLTNISYKIIKVDDSPGFLINKIIFKDISYFFYLLEVENFKHENILEIFKNNLNKNDPIRLLNIIGIDTSLAILKNLNNHDKNFYVPKILGEAVEKKILGYKNKKLFKL